MMLFSFRESILSLEEMGIDHSVQSKYDKAKGFSAIFQVVWAVYLFLNSCHSGDPSESLRIFAILTPLWVLNSNICFLNTMTLMKTTLYLLDFCLAIVLLNQDNFKICPMSVLLHLSYLLSRT